MRKPPAPNPRYTNQDAGKPTPGKVSSIRTGPMNGMAANHAGNVGGRMSENGRYGEARTPKAPMARTTMNQGMVISSTSMYPITA